MVEDRGIIIAVEVPDEIENRRIVVVKEGSAWIIHT